jgi:hypothetical protein
VPYAQQTDIGQMTFYVRSPLEAAGLGNRVRMLVRQADPGLPVTDMKTMRAQIHESLFVERIVAVLSAAFGFLATLPRRHRPLRRDELCRLAAHARDRHPGGPRARRGAPSS